MHSFDDNLLQLQQQVALKKQLEAKLRDLQEQRRIFDQRVLELRVAHHKEQADVEKLERKTLSNYFYRFTGKLEGMLEEELRQAAEAGIRLEVTQQELAGAEHQISQIQTQLRALAGCENAYQTALAEKRTVLKEAGTQAGEQILAMEERIAFLKSQKTEIAQSVAVGTKAASIARKILSKLDKADDWNTLDLWSGRKGFAGVTHIEKHIQLDDAQDLVHTLQAYLQEFTTELADIRIHTDLQVNIDGFLRFADYFFDCLFVDWKVREHITQSQDAVTNILHKIDSLLTKFKKMEQDTDKEITALERKIEALIIE